MKVYFDNAATTKVENEVKKLMQPYFDKIYGNASSLHFLGQQSRQAIEEAREKIAGFLGARREEIIFTSCATESNNLAIKGVVFAYDFLRKQKNPKYSFAEKPHIITSSIEHHAVLHTTEYLEKFGFQVTYLPVDKDGVIKVEDVEKNIKKNTVLVSIMYVNNEIGSIQPIKEIGQLLKKINEKRDKEKLPKIYFHTDAVQAFLYLDCNVQELGVDLLSLTGHKFHAPKGIGLLYIKKGTLILPQQTGGGHEFGLRAGTENIPYIVGLAKAMEIAFENREKEALKIKKLQRMVVDEVLNNIEDVVLIGSLTKKAPHIVSFCFKNIEGESLVLMLSQKGIATSSGSACTSGKLEPSHVLLACGVPPQIAHGSLRISLGKYNTEKEVKYFIEVLKKTVKKLEKISPKELL